MSVNELLPETAPSTVERSSQTIEVSGDSDVLDVLATETSRRVLLALADSSEAASDIANALDVSLQNVCYHLERIQDAGLIEVVGTRYSSKGREMQIYGLVTNPIVVQFDDGARSENDGERTLKSRTKMAGRVHIKSDVTRDTRD
jgi:DNA-binding transcriptional ArsR family regulator